MENNEKILNYSIEVSYLGILLRENLLSNEEYDHCLADLRKDYGIISDFRIDRK